MSSTDREYWDYRPEWREYVLSVWKGTGRVEQIKDDSIQPFRDRAWQAFEGRFPIRSIKTWVNVMLPAAGSGYDEGYPHVHYPLSGLTLIHYLDDSPTPLEIFESGEVVETIYPEPGLTVFVPNDVEHGVKKHNGTEPRAAMIATALI